MKHWILRLLPKTLSLKLKRWQFRRSCREEFERLQARRQGVNEHGYSYQGFDEKRAIFIHIPKCAGVSVAQALFGNLAGGHATLDKYLNVFEAHCIEEYFLFTIVRNPWDRLVSAYFFLKAGGYGEEDRKWYESTISGYTDFDDFVKHWLNRSNIWKRHHFRPQYYYLQDRAKKVSPDYIGFFETLDEDFTYIAKRMGVDGELPQRNTGKHRDYRNYYTDETRELVSHVYAEDIELLGYDFDNSSLKQQIRQRDAEMKP